MKIELLGSEVALSLGEGEEGNTEVRGKKGFRQNISSLSCCVMFLHVTEISPNATKICKVFSGAN